MPPSVPPNRALRTNRVKEEATSQTVSKGGKGIKALAAPTQSRDFGWLPDSLRPDPGSQLCERVGEQKTKPLGLLKELSAEGFYRNGAIKG